MPLKKIIPFILLYALLISCSSTKIQSSWKAENVSAKPYHNIMVWGLMMEKDSSLRARMENHLVNDLVGKGYHAISSLEVYQSRAYQKLTAEEILEDFKPTGVDAVITIALLNKEKEVRYYPGGFHSEISSLSGDLNNYYSGIYDRVFTPGYYITTTSYFWESSFFEVTPKKLIYAAHTHTFDPASTDKLAHEMGLLIINDMVKHDIIAHKAPHAE